MNTSDVVLLSAMIFCAALLYSAVGHGGASGYLAAMALVGHSANAGSLQDAIPFPVGAAVLGGMIGSGLGSRRFSSMTLRRLLASVLVVAGLKFICT